MNEARDKFIGRIPMLIRTLEIGGVDRAATEALMEILADEPARLLPAADQEIQQVAYLLHRNGESQVALALMRRVIQAQLALGVSQETLDFAVENLQWLHKQMGEPMTKNEILEALGGLPS